MKTQSYHYFKWIESKLVSKSIIRCVEHELDCTCPPFMGKGMMDADRNYTYKYIPPTRVLKETPRLSYPSVNPIRG